MLPSKETNLTNVSCVNFEKNLTSSYVFSFLLKIPIGIPDLNIFPEPEVYTMLPSSIKISLSTYSIFPSIQ